MFSWEEASMPNSKSADLRIKVIDRCLSDRNRKYSMADINGLCNKELENRAFPVITSMNSIRTDMDQIERMYWPDSEIERYTDPSGKRYIRRVRSLETIARKADLCS